MRRVWSPFVSNCTLSCLPFLEGVFALPTVLSPIVPLLLSQGDKTSGRRTHHPTQAHVWGDSGRQWQTRERPEKADIPSQAHMWGDNGRQKGKTTRREGGPTIQHRQTCGETMRDNALNGTEGVRRGDETLGRRTRHPTQAHMWGDNERQDVRKADAPSNTDTHAGRQWETLGDKGETRHRECKRIIQHRHTCGDETTGEKWRQGTGTADTPTNKKETRRETLGGRQRETRPRRTP